MEREVGPRVGVRGRMHPIQEDVDVNAYIERTPKTNEQLEREKSSSSWEYTFWVAVVIGVVIILLLLVLWFVFKKDDTPEVQKHVHPPEQQRKPQQQAEQVRRPQEEPHEGKEQNMADDARANLNRRGRRNIGPVPNEYPDNPSVFGIIPDKNSTASTGSQPGSSQSNSQVPPPNNVAQVVQPGAPQQTQQNASKPNQNEEHASDFEKNNLPDFQVSVVTNRLVSNLGMTE